MNNRVFPTQATPHDLTPAMQFGHLMKPVAHADYAGGVTSYAGIRAALTDFDVNLDYLLPIGDPINIGLAFTALYRLGHIKINVLKWNRVRGRYQPMVVTLDQLKWTALERE